jgi:hypothetical protein
MKKACQYAVIQFMPHPETGEFVNVGIVLQCPKEHYFDVKFLQKHGRVTHFFKQMDKRIYLEGQRLFNHEMMRVKKLFYQEVTHYQFDQGEHAIRMFADLTRSREGIFRFNRPGTVLAEDCPKKLNELFGFYVESEFLTADYQARLMEARVRDFLNEAALAEQFKGREVGDALCRTRFPFVALHEGKVIKIIKPFSLNQTTPNKVFSYADSWLQKVRRLRERNLLPEDVLFALTPPANKTLCLQASQDIQKQLIALNIQVTTLTNKEAIISFAQ